MSQTGVTLVRGPVHCAVSSSRSPPAGCRTIRLSTAAIPAGEHPGARLQASGETLKSAGGRATNPISSWGTPRHGAGAARPGVWATGASSPALGAGPDSAGAKVVTASSSCWNLGTVSLTTSRMGRRTTAGGTVMVPAFRDLEARTDGLDPNEDPLRPVEERVEDLLAQMTVEEKAGLMFHAMIAMNPDGPWSRRASGGVVSTTDLVPRGRSTSTSHARRPRQQVGVAQPDAGTRGRHPPRHTGDDLDRPAARLHRQPGCVLHRGGLLGLARADRPGRDRRPRTGAEFADIARRSTWPSASAWPSTRWPTWPPSRAGPARTAPSARTPTSRELVARVRPGCRGSARAGLVAA